MPIVWALIGLGLFAGTGYVVTKTGEVVDQPAIKLLGVAAVLYAAAQLVKATK